MPKDLKENEKFTKVEKKKKESWSLFKKKESPRVHDVNLLKKFEVSIDIGDILSCQMK